MEHSRQIFDGQKIRRREVSFGGEAVAMRGINYDISFRAITLYEQHDLTRQREGLVKLNPAVDPLRTELNTGKFTILVR